LNACFTGEDVITLAQSIARRADAISFGCMIMALSADLVVEALKGKVDNCASQLLIRFLLLIGFPP
jgi:NifU-like protein involved in Fe-S cluster formation